MRNLAHLDPGEAVAVAREHDDPPRAAERLDRYFRARLLEYLQLREGERGALAEALIDAEEWAAEQQSGFDERWQVLLEILSDSHRVASGAEHLDIVLSPEASKILALVVDAARAAEMLRPNDLAQQTGKSAQNVGNYLRRLEQQGLLVRRTFPGQQAVSVFPTPSGAALVEKTQAGTSSTSSTVGRSRNGEMPAEPVDPWPKLKLVS